MGTTSRFWALCQDNHLWKVLLRKRTGQVPPDSIDSYRRLYDEEGTVGLLVGEMLNSQKNAKLPPKLSRGGLLTIQLYRLVDQLVLSIADDCEIAHNHQPYWRQRDDQRGLFGRVSVLIAVSWLHVTGRIRGIHAGKYRVIWRLSAMPRASNIFDIDFIATSTSGYVTESQLPFSSNLLEFGSDYFDFVLPQPLIVSDPFEDVLLECKSTSQDWKSNLTLCSVRLEPIDRRPYAQRYRRNGHREILANNVEVRSHRRRLSAAKSRPGANYRLWKPWKVHQWYEEVLLAMFAAAIAAFFAYLLLDGTR
ncbi:hypothetical protein H4S01_001314 [Coemansia sp. RSA 2610]|nr:hypothetical protein H4S01_001314 [Coemansia sp. RSA 2610]